MFGKFLSIIFTFSLLTLTTGCKRKTEHLETREYVVKVDDTMNRESGVFAAADDIMWSEEDLK